MTDKPVSYYMDLPYQIVITPDDEGYGVHLPDLPGCHTHAERWEDIQRMIREAMSLWLTIMIEDGKEIPEPKPQPTA
ncbi:MAG: type II toxin-antitoxin system HicB family antitoxin [Anaerolineaceae bacterium]|nr:MAG: type II toxin-antitoxin system HicB family antitoxin [Anaerolineaceae bacterium]